MTDIALVPERLVFQRGLGVAAHHPGQATHPLAQDRVAFVRHRGRALLLLAERFPDLGDLTPLQMPDVRGEFLQAAGQHSQR